MRTTLYTVIVISVLLGIGSGFPIEGNDSDNTVMVFGSLIVDDPHSTDNILNVDIASSGWIEVKLVDTDDRFYNSKFNTDHVSLYDDTPKMGLRAIYKFKVPENIEIKSIRCQFRKMDRSDADLIGNPIVVNWQEYPAVEDNGIGMTFYGASYDIQETVKFWHFDVKVTNLGDQPITISERDFQCTDQAAWMYTASGNDETILLPNESVRTDINFKMSGMSKPSYLGYNDGQVFVEISGWV